jgi:tetratricopeptide (TPR) repeat protein
MYRKIVIGVVLVWLLNLYTFGQEKSHQQKWTEDIDYMSTSMKKYHKNLFHTISERTFDSLILALKEKAPSLKPHQIIIEIAKIEAAIGDGHTNLNLLKNAGFTFHNFPVRFYLFADGLYIRATDPDHQRLLGAKVMQVGGVKVDEALLRIRSIIGSDNPYGKSYFESYYINIVEVLHALKISGSLDSTRFSLDIKGAPVHVWLKPKYEQEFVKGDVDTYWINPMGWKDARREGQTPLWLQAKSTDKYGLTYLPEEKVLYVQINEINSNEGRKESLEQFYDRIFKTGDSVGAEKLVLDLRLNGGGNGYYNKPLVIGLIKSRFDAPGKLFVLTGRRTFSAAQMLVTLLKTYTHVIQIGEPTGSKDNHYGDSRRIPLPNSGIIVRASTLWHQLGSASEDNLITGPHHYVPYSSNDYFTNKDPLLTAVFHYRPELSLRKRLEAYKGATYDSSEIVNTYWAFKNDPSKRFVNTKIELRDWGITLYNGSDFKTAKLIFLLNAQEYNTVREWTLTALAYEKSGEKEKALESYQKALALDKTNEDLIKSIARLTN